MNRRLASLLAVVLGVLTLRLTLSGDYLFYVRRGMFFWLSLSGTILIVLGVIGWLSAKSADDHQSDGCSHGHGHALPRAVWLLLLPILAVGLTQPIPLGSFAASRQSTGVPRQSTDVAKLVEDIVDPDGPVPVEALPDLAEVAPPADPIPDVAPTQVAGKPLPSPAPGEIAEMSLLDFLEITYYDETNALEGIPVRLVGFVMPSADQTRGKFLLSRFMINCCAADATLMQTAITQVKVPVPQTDTWVSVTGKWYPGANSSFSPDGFPVPELVADKVQVIPAPQDPYLSLAVF
ncbi:MAG: TIGR03943 family protein [Actinomycetota bacterium]